ncbi:hypothetical protein [Burkholderia gladioli]|uniref:hypothetical protein n=1 Tax=Burkholderia gladioli TaxID=28095 RepID=UPI0016416D20|nr:hypothetical protein [Burkholderia gladioli]MBJ9679362.1 hypothetical protein [Burkholderia gladioli]MDN7464678.1 hypothetical protein [Burkholderia gladioli]
MRYMIVIAVLEIAAIVVVMALCIAARRADTRTERMLTREEIEARRRPADAQRRRPASAAARWLRRLFDDGRRR